MISMNLRQWRVPGPRSVAPRSWTRQSWVSIALLAAIAATTARAEETADEPTFLKLQISDQFYCEGATCGDINGDGNLDFIAGPYWFAGPKFTDVKEFRPPKVFPVDGYSNQFLTYAHDVNRDGRVDVLVIGFPGETAHWYENTGSWDEHWPERKIGPIVDNESPALVDMTGDDTPELLCQSEGYFGFMSIPDNADQDWPFQPISPDLGYGRFTHGLGRGDVNGDGRLDLLEKNGWWEQPADSSSSTPWRFHAVSFSEPGGAQMFAWDIDGDGDNDVMTSKAAHSYGLSWFENLGGTSDIEFREHVVLSADETAPSDPMFSQLHALALADVNNDGVLDIVTGKRYWAHNGNDPGARDPAVLYWFETVRRGGGAEFRPHLIDSDSGVGTQVEARDISGDGRIDILVGNKKGLFVFLQN